jgi:CCR4-NOT complex subunit CAF16
MRPFTLLLLDEVTVDLDVLARAELMNFLTAECAERGATIVYATHIFDGLERWATHLALLASGRLALTLTAEMPQLAKYNGRLFPFMHAWLREDQQRVAALPSAKSNPKEILMNNGWGAGRSAPTVATR